MAPPQRGLPKASVPPKTLALIGMAIAICVILLAQIEVQIAAAE
jgi:hypothetical protein